MVNPPRKNYDRFWKFGKLKVDEAKRLLRVLALEEEGLEPEMQNALNVHCCSREHPHQHDTASLFVNFKK